MGAMVSRRALLRGGVAVGAAVALAGALHLPGPSEGARLLSAAERQIVAAVAEVMFPPMAPFPVDGRTAGLEDEVDRIVADCIPALHAAGFRYLLRALEWGAVASHGARFSRLGVADRAEILTIWSDPTVLPRRIAGDALKMVMGMAYFGDRRVLEAIGYRAECGGGLA